MPTPLNLADFEEVPAAPAGPRPLDLSQFEEVEAGGAPVPERRKGVITLMPQPVQEIESFARGATQGITLGFRDELVGAVESVFGDKTYREARDEGRALDRAAREANPRSYLGGEFAGAAATSFVPGLNAAKAASLGTKVAVSGLTGGLAGVGASEADTIGGQFKDAMKGAAFGAGTTAAFGGIGKVIKGAPARADERVIDGLTLGATAKQRDRVVGELGAKKETVLKLVHDTPGLEKAALAGDSAEAHALVVEKLAKFNRVRDSIYDKVDQASPGMLVSNVLGEVESIKNSLLSRPGQAPLAREVESRLDDVLNAWGNRTHVGAREVRQLATDLGGAAFRSAPGVDPSAAEKVGRRVYGALVSMIDQHVDDVAKTAKIGVSSAKLRRTNEAISTFMNLESSLLKKATREASPPTTLRSGAGKLVKAGGVLASLASGSVAPAAAVLAGPTAARAADVALARLVRAAQGGKAGKALEPFMRAALDAGIPRTSADWVVRNFGAAQEKPD